MTLESMYNVCPFASPDTIIFYNASVLVFRTNWDRRKLRLVN